MATKKQYGEGTLEFENFPARTDIRVSKVVTTANGDEIRAIVTTGDSIVLTAVGQSNADTVTITGEPGSMPDDTVAYSSYWKQAFEIGKVIADTVFGDKGGEDSDGGGGDSGGGGDRCTTTTTIKVDQKGKVTSITTKTECRPA